MRASAASAGWMEIPRMSYRYQSRRDDTAVRDPLLELARETPHFDYRRLWALPRDRRLGGRAHQPRASMACLPRSGLERATHSPRTITARTVGPTRYVSH